MTDLLMQIAEDLQKQIEGFEPKLNCSDIGIVVETSDGIARIHGPANIKVQELYF
jgi:F0F1-type ATP synthase alpha subunit